MAEHKFGTVKYNYRRNSRWANFWGTSSKDAAKFPFVQKVSITRLRARVRNNGYIQQNKPNNINCVFQLYNSSSLLLYI